MSGFINHMQFFDQIVEYLVVIRVVIRVLLCRIIRAFEVIYIDMEVDIERLDTVCGIANLYLFPKCLLIAM